MCGADGTSLFLSACQAGCRNSGPGPGLYQDCACTANTSLAGPAWWEEELAAPLAETARTKFEAAVKSGYCPFDCRYPRH